MLKISQAFINRIVGIFVFLFIILTSTLTGIVTSESKIINTSYKLNAVDFGLSFSTFFCGDSNDACYQIAVANDGCFYVTGYTFSNDFPTSNGYDSSYGGNIDAFVSEFTAIGSLTYSSYLGGDGWDAGQGIAFESDGSYFIAGFTVSSNYPISNEYDNTHNGGHDVFITQLNIISCQASTNGILIFIVIIPIIVWVQRKRRE